MILTGIICKLDITFRIIRFGIVPHFVYSKTLLGIKMHTWKHVGLCTVENKAIAGENPVIDLFNSC